MRLMKKGFVGLMLGCVSNSAFAISELWLDRYAYDAIQQGFNKKDISVYHKKRGDLDNYPLSGYADYRAFLFDLKNKTPEEVNQFSNEFANYPFSVSIRADYLNALIATKNWPYLIAYQTELPRDQDYQCWYYTAFYHENELDTAFNGAKLLWLDGESVSSACNSLFSYWDKAGERTDNMILERALYAVDAKNPRLITYLRKLASTVDSKDTLTEMLRLYRQPEKFTVFFETKEDTQFNRNYVQTALKHLAKHNINSAYDKVSFVQSHFSFEDNELQSTLEFLAVRLLDTKDPEIIQWRDEVLERSNDNLVLEQRIRLAIRKTEWNEIIFWINKLTSEEQASYRWQYWLARSEMKLGDTESGETRLKRIAGNRHFYSIAASIALKREPRFPIARVECNKEQLEPYQDDIDRVEELLALGKTYPARKHWRHVVAKENQAKSAVLACYAKKKHWHLFAHEATIRGELWDYIYLRFPVRYWKEFSRYGAKYNVEPVTLLALSRQESGLELTTKSPVGARGLMQVLPSTAAFMAQKYNLNYRHSSDLFDLDKNVAVGSRYLSHLLARYKNNRAYAFSAYNAGPTMVTVWRRAASKEIDIFGYIESISFKETRVYVKNIFMFEMYYREILKLEGDFLRPSELTNSI
ncbi:transglycosylase SLT domain-containing protein [Aliivibrio fischeri]|uniref:Soluble lytic murein transglycosylase n=1 Tax=Aliivibrio fischeri SR5 TaxID=1088719 RepID=A0AAV3ESI7_ALIFS|nr:transglycosylase SLT domain-containing protein [Aliivibrio fischeri]EHN69740.1 soluble lytic murein transglycosylase [Aliivibrio fischeri SR5]